MKKRILSLLLAVLTVLSLFPFAVFATEAELETHAHEEETTITVSEGGTQTSVPEVTTTEA